jgi:DNA-binding transcriptional LysR family regulator
LALQLRHQNEQRLRIGVTPYSDQIRRRRELIGRFSTEHRDIVVELEVGWTPSLLARVRSGDLDVAFATGRIEDADIEAIPLYSIGIDLLMSQNNPLASLNMIVPAQLAGRPVAVLSRAAHPDLIDELSAPLIDAGASLVQIPEMSESVLDRILGSEQLVAAMFHFADEQFADAAIVWRPFETPPKVQFSLARRRGAATSISQSFWTMAAQGRSPGTSHNVQELCA